MSTKILVCGGRDFTDYNRLRTALDYICTERNLWADNEYQFPALVTIISGKAKGADSLAIDWAVVNYAQFKEFPADWSTHGKAAGPIRNQQMLDEGQPDLVVAFPGGRGTADMIRRSKKTGIEVIEIVN